MRVPLVLGLAVAAALHSDAPQGRPAPAGGQQPAAARLSPTAHPPLPATLSEYWLVPDETSGQPSDALAGLAEGVRLIAEQEFEQALPLVASVGLAATPLAGYAQFYTGVALHELKRLPEADSALTALVEDDISGPLQEAAVLRLAAVAVDRGDAGRAEELLEDLSGQDVGDPAEVLVRLGRVEELLDHREHALDAYRRVYYEHPLSEQAVEAQDAIERLETASLVPPDRFDLELARAERLFAAGRWAQARAAFAALSRAAGREHRARVAIRLAECDYHLGRHRAARDGLQPYLEGGPLEAEARFFHLRAVRALGAHATYVALARRLVADHPGSTWAAEALDGLASHYIIVDDEAQADRVFRELRTRFPRHRYSERAAWKIGWYAYRNGRFAETAEVFEAAAAAFPRADYRPAWLYWAGRARDRLGEAAAAGERYRLAVIDYGNSYYGRLAARQLDARRAGGEVPGAAAAPGEKAPSIPDAAAALIRELLRAGLYDDALQELRHARRVWGDSPRLQATVAWTLHQQGLRLRARERFTALRGAINTMRRAYPQFLSAAGEALPPEVLRIIFPLDFWPLIQKYPRLHELDPYLLAALMAQESTFTPEIRSAANAYGLMQIIPATGRQLARALGIRRFTVSMLTEPETNVRMGTRYFADLIERFGGVHYALAGYNAGPDRVAAWIAEAPGLPADEFIDDIPYPETQNYVKRILGTAEDYRRLYGPGGVLDPNLRLAAAAPAIPPAPAPRP